MDYINKTLLLEELWDWYEPDPQDDVDKGANMVIRAMDRWINKHSETKTDCEKEG